MSSVQNFLSNNLIFLIFRNQCAQGYLIYYSTYTPLHIQITTFFSNRTREQTTIFQSDLFIYLMIQYLLRYYHNRIALHQASRIMLNLSLFPVAGLALLTVPRDAGGDHRHKIDRVNAAVREQAIHRMSTPARYHIRFSSQRDYAGYRARDAVRRSLDLSNGELFYYNASVGVTAIRLPY